MKSEQFVCVLKQSILNLKILFKAIQSRFINMNLLLLIRKWLVIGTQIFWGIAALLPLILPSKNLLMDIELLKLSLFWMESLIKKYKILQSMTIMLSKFHIQLLFEDFLESQKLGRN